MFSVKVIIAGYNHTNGNYDHKGHNDEQYRCISRLEYPITDILIVDDSFCFFGWVGYSILECQSTVINYLVLTNPARSPNPKQPLIGIPIV
ncbi:MAG: hypothetical protein WA667_17970 [Candidatus Nitrosopolaris sp.]